MTHIKLRQFLAPTLIVVIGVLAWSIGFEMSSAKKVLLKTDLLIALLLVACIYFIAYIRQRPHLRNPWRRVFQRKLSMVAAVILITYAIIGLLDSVHYKSALENVEGQVEVHYGGDVHSLLDLLLAPIHTKHETTYSAPFATHLHMKESMELPDGTRVRDYPRLEHGGSHLQDLAQKNIDILVRVSIAILLALLTWLLLICVIALFARQQASFGVKFKRLIVGPNIIPWHMALWTVLIILILVFMVAIIGPYYHIFGTDKVGKDVLYLALKSIRTGLVIGTLTTLVMLPFAIALGTAAGYFRRWIDDVIQYLYTVLNSIPGVLLIAAAVLSIQVYIANHPDLYKTSTDRADLRLLALCIILGITSWTGLCRLLRAESLKLRELEYIQAAQAFGVRHGRILLRHILPNVMHIVLIVVVLDFSGLVLAEAVLSYVGVGVDPTMISWGNMINAARLEMAREPMVWWSLLAAFVFMLTLVLAANLFADAVRDAFDPRLRQA